MERAQKFADRFCSLNWPRLLNGYAKKVNPLMADLLKSMSYYWVTAQSEYSTDILFKNTSLLNQLYPRLLSHSTLCFGATEVMSFLGRKISPLFHGDVVSVTCDLSFMSILGVWCLQRLMQNCVTQ